MARATSCGSTPDLPSRQVASVDDYGASAELQLAEGADPQALLAALVHERVGLRHFELVEPSLQSIFIAKVGADAAVAHAEVSA